MIKKLLFLFAFVNISLASANALAVPGNFIIDGINYEINGISSVKVIANSETGYSGSVVIPSVITYYDEPYNVTEIAESAFANSYGLSFVNIPKSITSIGDHAFANCFNLKQITSNIEVALPISSSVFTNVYLDYCKLIVPTGKKELYELAFIWQDFANISDVKPFVIDAVAYEITSTQPAAVKVVLNTENPTSTLIRIPATVSYNDVVYEVTEISNTAFNGYNQLNQITCEIINPLQVSEEVFYNINVESCRLIVPTASLDLYKNADGWKEFLKITDAEPFIVDGLAYEITSKATPATVEVVNNTDGNYEGSITIPSTVTYENITYNVTTIYSEAFRYNEELTAITIGNNITAVPEYAFEDCTSLSSVHIGNSVTSFEKAAFTHCENLTTINIPTSITSIGKEVFAYCKSLTSLEVPNSVTYIGDYAFNNSGLTSFSFPNSITEVSFAVLTNCKSLSNVTIPASVQSIRQYAFNFCPNLKLITCNVASPIEIDNTVFSGTTPVLSATLIVPTNSMDDYKNAAHWEDFYRITNIEPTVINEISYEFTSGSTVKVIASLGKNYTGAIVIPATVNYKGDDYLVTAIAESAFEGIYNDDLTASKSLTTKSSITSITSITIGENVNSIEDYAFADCANLTSVICMNPNVAVINANAFYGVDQANCSLKVPSSSVSSYKTANVWKDFSPIEANATLGTNNFNTSNGVAIYPTSIQNELFIVLSTTDKTSIQLFDTTGKTLIQKTTNSSLNTINTSELARGIYFIKVTANEATVTKKLIKI
ncbi:leucine-rich repeat protein [Flavobacterium algicola]|uniref:leucine-rich repeat protein n=1 Tax=Flavobacterium algicola TaxID=556529 RepID=UPI001EFE7F90|nr:leucine-rich repeat protein [Flavobacterium algicola]MCG9791662.1 leucine-rich repeat domain-containing protein [Flavobacterium algicola]